MIDDQSNTPSIKSGLTLDSLNATLKSTSKSLQLHLGFIITVILLLVLVYNVYAVNSALLNQSSNISTADSTVVQNFDKATVIKIQTLRNTTSPNDISLPSGRINPFSE